MQDRGFTLIELILTIILLAILGSLVAPRFYSSEGQLVQARRDDVLAALFYAQQIAMARDSAANPIRVVTTSNSISVTENAAPLRHADVQYPLVFAGGVTLAPASTLNFDKLGRTTASVFTLSRSGVSATITVSASGYAN